MSIEIILLEEVHVIGGHDSRRLLSSDLQTRLDVFLFATAPGANQFQVITIAENLQPIVNQVICSNLVTVQQGSADVPLYASRQGNQSRTALLVQPFAPRERLTARAFLEIDACQQAREVPIPGKVLTEQYERIRGSLLVIGSDSQVRTDNGFHSPVDSTAIELDHAEQIVLIRQCDCRDIRSDTRVDKIRNAHGAVDERIFAVQVEMHESGRRHSSSRTGAKLRRC